MMNLIQGIMYKVREGHRFHSGRFGQFEFIGGPERDVIVMSDLKDSHTMFVVGLDDLTDFNPKVDQIIEKGIVGRGSIAATNSN